MPESLIHRKDKLKDAILASMLLDSEQLEEVFALIEGMNEDQLNNTEKHFAKAKGARDDLLDRLFAKDKKAVQVVDKIAESMEKYVQVEGLASLGREILRETIKK